MLIKIAQWIGVAFFLYGIGFMVYEEFIVKPKDESKKDFLNVVNSDTTKYYVKGKVFKTFYAESNLDYDDYFLKVKVDKIYPEKEKPDTIEIYFRNEHRLKSGGFERSDSVEINKDYIFIVDKIKSRFTIIGYKEHVYPYSDIKWKELIAKLK